MPSTPQRILFLRPDAYGDLFLFEPVPRLVRHVWPHAEVAVLIRQPYADAIPLFADESVRWLTTACDPYREGPGDNPVALAGLRDAVREFAPDCLVAACSEQTWLEAAAAAFSPGARQISMGRGVTDPWVRAALEAVLPVDWAAIYLEKVVVEPGWTEWEKNMSLADALLGHPAPRWWPVARVPESARMRAGEILAEAGLSVGEYAVCPAAGTANVQIKNWPAENYGETLAWLEQKQGVRALLIGHVSERDHLQSVREAARYHGGTEPALWLGQDGEMPIAAGLLEAARFYLGNDTGALHLAAALGRPVVGIFGGGTWPRFKPVAARAWTVVQPLPCFGCAWDCYFEDAPCVRTISTASVRTALEQVLDDAADGHRIVEANGLEAGARRLIDHATPRMRFLREDSADRLRQVFELTLQTGELSHRLQTSDADRDARQDQVRKLTALLETTGTDCAARLGQVDELTALLKKSETDRAARMKQVDELTALLKNSDADRDARQIQVQELTDLLKTSDNDRAARLKQVDELTALLKVSDRDRDARQSQVQELTTLLTASESDRDARLKQIDELTALLTASESDRAIRLTHVEELAALLAASDADRAARLSQVEELTQLLLADGTEPVPPAELPVELGVHTHAANVESGVPGEHP